MKTLSNSKGTKSDSMAVRLELQARGMMKEFHPQETGQVDTNGNPLFTYARAAWVWRPDELKAVMDVLRTVRTPTNYGSSLSYKIGDKTMAGLKTHDWHNILQDILPIAIRGTLTPGLRDTVYKLAAFFRKACAKELKISAVIDMKEEAAELATLMEIHLPPTFLDIQPHHVLHMPDEILMAGPVRPRWMYFVERYMKVLKGWVRQIARPESSIAEGYITHEAMKYASEYVKGADFGINSAWMDEDVDKTSREKLPTAFTMKVINTILYEQAHRFVLMNHPLMQPWLERYTIEKIVKPNLKSFRSWVYEALMKALEERNPLASDEALDISAGPSFKANFYTG